MLGRMRSVSVQERRARLARRHGLHPGWRLPDAEAATRAMTVLHSTEPATVHLSLAARIDGLTVDAVEKALYDERSLVKQLAMRRTLFVFPRDLLPAAWGSASARVARTEWARLVKDVVAAGLATDGDAWLQTATEAVLGALGEGPLGTADLRARLPELAGTVEISPGTKWGGAVQVAPRVMTQLGAQGRIVRGDNAGHWRLSRPAWTLMEHWLGESPVALDEHAGYSELVRRWLWTFGPGTTTDLQWWLGSTKAAVTHALTDCAAVAVDLDGEQGWLLPDDLDEEPPVEPWAALLPVLDPTVMGWKQRNFLLGPHAGSLFDRNGNAGTTAWWDGRVVGCWVQDPAGVVHLRLLEDVPASGGAALQAEAERLTAWLDGVRISTVYSSPAMKG
jgi:hypothetical protein